MDSSNNPLANLAAEASQAMKSFEMKQTEFFPPTRPEGHSEPPKPQGQKPVSAADLAAMKEKIGKIMKMENLADITLAGYMIKLMRYKNKLSFKELHDEVCKCYDTLRRSDGSKYTGDVAKALKGCLTSSEIFKEVGDNVWAIREKEAKLYEEKTTKKLKTLINKKKGRSGRKKESDNEEDGDSDDNLSESDHGSAESGDEKALPAKKVKQSNGEYQKVAYALEAAKNKLRGPDASTQNLIDLINITDTPEDLAQKIGNDRFQGIIDCYEFFYPILQEHLKQGALSSLPATAQKGKKK